MDGLPNQLCDNCIFQLNQSYLFRKHCQKIDESLRFFVEENLAEEVEENIAAEISEPELPYPEEDREFNCYESEITIGKFHNY